MGWSSIIFSKDYKILKKSKILVTGAGESIGLALSSSLRSDENMLTEDQVYKMLEKAALLEKE